MEQERVHPLVRFIGAVLQKEGSLWLEEDNLNRWAEKSKADISMLEKLCSIGKIKKLGFDGHFYYTLPAIHILETEAAYNAIRILYSDRLGEIPAATIDKRIDRIEKEIGITLHPEQRKAVHTMVNNGFCVITGGPGTGKTCTLNVAIQVIEDLYPGICIRFTAPTGKAAGRITEATKRYAKTIQRELKITYTKKTPDIFEGDVLIIDEVSMLDMETASNVFKAIRDGQRVILIGDTDQLPSVGAGAVLRDLLDSNVIPNTRLTKTFRQAEDSALFANILRTKSGKYPLVYDESEFVIEQAQKGTKALEQIADTFFKEVQKVGLDNCVCLIPFRRKGIVCSNNLNNILQKKINPLSIGKKYLVSQLDDKSRVMYIIGDPVMQLVNRTECANGDVGKIIDIEGDRLFVKFKDPSGKDVIIKYWKSELPSQLSLAYAMSINKSQGSEYKTVVMCMTLEHSIMLSRNMLYTGITRAKEKVVYIHEPEATKIAMKNIAMYVNEKTNGRTTLFGEKLRFYYKQFEKALMSA